MLSIRKAVAVRQGAEMLDNTGGSEGMRCHWDRWVIMGVRGVVGASAIKVLRDTHKS